MRTEHLRFEVKVDSRLAKLCRKEIDLLLEPNNTSVEKLGVRHGDTVTVTYDLYINYFGQTVERLKALTRLAKRGDNIVAASLKELEYGKSVIVETLRAFDETINHLKGK